MNNVLPFRRRPRGPRRSDILLGCVAFGAVVAIGVWLSGGHLEPRPWRHPPGSSLADHFEAVDRSQVRITDGDTFRIGGERVRILNIDAPEMPDHAHCQREAQLALQARDWLRQRLASAQRIEVARQNLDRYGRTLATVRTDGQDVGEAIMAAGLAQRWEGHHARWC